MMVTRSKAPAFLLLFSGFFLLLIVTLPIISFLLQEIFNPTPKLIDPTQVSKTPLPKIVNNIGLSSLDYSRPQNWFPTSVSLPSASTKSSVLYYSLSIPSVKIVDVPVEINGTDLKKNPIHFPGSGLPGQFGNSVIFGHSSLPIFYKVNNPLTIFNPLLKVKVGDEVTVKYDGVTYKYLVRQVSEVSADDVSVLTQDMTERRLTIITCVPLGTYWRRLVVRAQIINQ